MNIRHTLALASLACATSTMSCKAEQATPSPTPIAQVPPVREVSTDGAFVLESPYHLAAQAYKGQLHSHTTNSDGRQRPREFVTAYKNAGYDFIAVTDHDHATPDPGVPGILFMHGMESEDGCHHENRIGRAAVSNPFIAKHARSQSVVDAARSQGAFVQINHPDWPGTYPANPCWSDKDLLAMTGYDAVEVWNASDIVDGDPNSEARVDYLLSHGRRTNLTAVDDCHDAHAAYCMTSSVMVFAAALTAENILANLKAGNFYASRGGKISSVSIDGTNVVIALGHVGDIEFIADKGAVVKTVHGVASATYAVKGDEKYVRMRVSQPGGAMAWTNPIYVTPR